MKNLQLKAIETMENKLDELKAHVSYKKELM